MFSARWIRSPCRNPAVKTRHHSPPSDWITPIPCAAQMPPSPIALPQRAPSANAVLPVVLSPPLPVKTSTRKAATLIAIRTKVARATDDAEAANVGVRTLVLSRAHSGQRIPTDVGVMQSGQIGRSQREQETPVSRSGCR